jgi:hypothetical protein
MLSIDCAVKMSISAFITNLEVNMTMRFSLFGSIGLALAVFLTAAPAQAQATRTWVSGVGDDANPCSRTAPCKTFAGAISKTAAGGEINCIDPAGFGAVTIVKAMTIDCTPVVGGVLTAGTNGVIVNAGVADVVVLRGLDIIGSLSVPGLNGIRFIAGRSLSVEKSVIREFTSLAPNGNGIQFSPTAASALFVSDTTISNNSASGITVRPSGAGSAKATIYNSSIVGNDVGVTADTFTSASTGVVSVAVRDSAVTNNSTAGVISATTAVSGNAAILVDRTAVLLNATGVNAAGAKAAILVGGSSIWSNSTSGITVSGGGQVFSTGNNIVSNGVNGSFTPPVVALQ